MFVSQKVAPLFDIKLAIGDKALHVTVVCEF